MTDLYDGLSYDFGHGSDWYVFDVSFEIDLFCAWLLFLLLLFCAVGSVLVELMCVVLIIFAFVEEKVIEFRLCVGECFFVVHSLLVE